MNPVHLLLAGAIVAVYLWALWRLLRSESAASLWVIAGLMAVSLLLRLIDYSRYPGGLNSDEPAILLSARGAGGSLFSEGPSTLPTLIPMLFEAPLAPLVGFGRWAIRLYSLVCSVLSVPAAFAAARAMRMRPISALVAAAFVVVLPWSIFYGRISQGGELLFHQLLLLAALARLIWRDGGWREVAFGGLGLCLLFYDYFSGRSMLAMPFVAAVLARGRARLLCLAIAVVAMIAFLPQAIQRHAHAFIGLSSLNVHSGYNEAPLQTLALKFVNALAALAYPVATNGWMTVTTAGVHPWLVLGLALLGLTTGFRRALFLGAGLVVGVMPSVASHGDMMASAHRMHSAFIFVSLAAGAAFDLIPWRTLRAMLAAGVVAVVGVWSVTFYFSSAFWTMEATWQFDNDSTDLVESIAADEAQVFDAGLGPFLAMREDLGTRLQELTAERLMLDQPGLYAFAAPFLPLRPFYESLLKNGEIRRFGRAFTVRVGHADLTWLRQHGWAYRTTCGDSTREIQVPTLFHAVAAFPGLPCHQPGEHLWRGRWLGPASKLRLRYEGEVAIETAPGEVIRGSAPPPWIDFDVAPDAPLEIRLSRPGEAIAFLYVVVNDTERLPYWEWVAPPATPSADRG